MTKNSIKATFSSKKNSKNSIALITDVSEENKMTSQVNMASKNSLSILQKQNQDLIEKLSKISKEKNLLENKIKSGEKKKSSFSSIK